MKITPSEIRKYLGMLEATPQTIAALTSGLGEVRLHESPGKRDWSVVEILAHLRGCEDIWSYSIYAMLAENELTLALLDERRWAKAAQYAALDFYPSFQVFMLKRAELLRVLHGLPEAAWERSAMIEGRRHTVFSHARRMALHEAEHCQQIETLLKDGDFR